LETHAKNKKRVQKKVSPSLPKSFKSNFTVLYAIENAF
jgi:hypothetical protein